MSKQDYIDHVVGSLPTWFVRNERNMENIKAFAEIFCRAEDQSVFFHQMTFIDQATEGPPDWLNQHAIDRSLLRQGGEDNATLRQRIRSFDNSLSYEALLAYIQNIATAAGLVGTVTLLELRQNKAFSLVNADQSGTGGEFTDLSDGDDGFAFEPDAGVTLSSMLNPNAREQCLTISSANSAGNDGTFVTDGAYESGPSYDNPTGVAETDPGAAWRLFTKDLDDEDVTTFQDAFFYDPATVGGNQAAYRMTDQVQVLVVILPFGCTQTLVDSIQDGLSLIKGAGVKISVECRLNP